MKLSIPINADLGEGLNSDGQLMPFLSSCNIACGGHAGNHATMTATVRLAKQFSVGVGAHPSFPDKENFGRKIISMTAKALTKSILSQINALIQVCEQLSIELNHIKPHGALYNLAAKDATTANAVLEAIDMLPKKVPIYTLPNSMLSRLAKNDFEIINEAFLDRTYLEDGSLMPRSQNGSLLVRKEEIWEQCKNLYFDKRVLASNGNYISLEAQTFCIHGDTPEIYNSLLYVNEQLNKASL